MKTQGTNEEMLFTHVSVDCVLMSINDDKLCVLLVERKDTEGNVLGYKLPGSLIYDGEDLDDAASRILNESTGLKRVQLHQFRCFGSPSRTSNKSDMQWLEDSLKMKIGRLITIAYLALCKNGRKTTLGNPSDSVRWCPVDELPYLPFDHLEIITAAMDEIIGWIEREPAIVFNYLPSKFTAFQLRRTFEIIYNKKLDVRNFHKKMNSLEYVVQTDEIETGVSHRAARYYRFDKIKYNKQRSKFNRN